MPAMTLLALKTEQFAGDLVPPVGKPIRRQASAVDWAHRALFRSIVSLNLPPGETLSRKVLAKWLGVSMTPLRDALLRLEVQGLVETRPQADTRVTLLNAADLHALQFERVAMETELVLRLARRKDVSMKGAEIALRRQISATSNKDTTALDLAFHETLFAAAGLDCAFARFRLRHVHLERCLNSAPLTTDDQALACDFHRQIVDRIKAQDGKGAAAAMRAHLSDDAATIGKVLRSKPEWFTES